MRKKPIARVVTYLVLVTVALYALIPFITIILTSVRSEADLARGPFTLPSELSFVENYLRAWRDGRFHIYLKNSIAILVPSVVGNLIVVTLAGYSFAKIKFPGRKILFALLMLSMMIPFHSIMIPLYLVMTKLHLLNKLMGIAILQIGTVGFGVFMMQSFFVTTPDELIEAGSIDGCGELRTIWHIIFPITLPAWSSLIVFNSLGSWNNLLAPILFLYKETLFPVPYALYAFQANFDTDYSLVSIIIIGLFPLGHIGQIIDLPLRQKTAPRAVFL